MNCDELSVVHATAAARKVGTRRYMLTGSREAWHDIAEVARSIAWLVGGEIRTYAPLVGSDASVATTCAAMLERASKGRTDDEGHRNAQLVVLLLERSDAAVKALGGTVAVKVAGGAA